METRVRTGGYTIVEACVGVALGALVMGGAFALVSSAQTVQKGVSGVTRTQAKTRDIFGALRDAVSMTELDRVVIRDLPDGCQSIELDYVVGHLFGKPLWGVYTQGVGELVPASRVLGAMGTDYANVTSWADDLERVENLRQMFPKGIAYKERYFAVTGADSEDGTPTRGLFRALINPGGQIACVESIARLYAVDDTPGFQVRRAGLAVVIECHLLTEADKIETVKFQVLPRN